MLKKTILASLIALVGCYNSCCDGLAKDNQQNLTSPTRISSLEQITDKGLVQALEPYKEAVNASSGCVEDFCFQFDAKFNYETNTVTFNLKGQYQGEKTIPQVDLVYSICGAKKEKDGWRGACVGFPKNKKLGHFTKGQTFADQAEITSEHYFEIFIWHLPHVSIIFSEKARREVEPDADLGILVYNQKLKQ